GVLLSLFPPRSETSRLFQFLHRVIGCWVAVLRRWFATPSLLDGRCSLPDPTLWQGWHWVHLSAHPSTAALPAQGSVGFSQTPYLSTCCRCFGTYDTGTLVYRYAWCGGTGGHLPQGPCTGDYGNVGPARGSAPLSTGYRLVGRVVRLLGIPSYLYSTIKPHPVHT